MKTRRKYVGWVLAALAAVMILAALVKSDPEYQGKTAKAWIEEFGFRPGAGAYVFVSAAPRDGVITNINGVEYREIHGPKIFNGSTNAARAASVVRIRRNCLLEDKLPSAFYCAELADPAAIAIREIGPAAVPSLIRALHRDGRFDRVSEFVWKHTPAGVRGKNLFPRPAVEVRRNAAVLLSQLGPDARPAVPALIKGLSDVDGLVRQNCSEALGMHGEQARGAVRALRENLSSTDPRVQTEAFVALDRIGGISDADAATNAAWGLKQWGGAGLVQIVKMRELSGPIALHSLNSLFGVSDDALLTMVLGQISRIGPQASSLIPGLIPLLDRPEYWIRFGAARAAGAIGPAAEPALAKLEALKRDPDIQVATNAVAAIAKIRAQKGKLD